MKVYTVLIGLAAVFLIACSHKIAPTATVSPTAAAAFPPPPDSYINIPIDINLKPFFALAEKKVDTVFTSPHYPADWVVADCATRYKYYFRRSPLRLQASGATMTLAFTGFYKIIGSTRVCAGSTVLSPWTPDCRCGFDEGERRVNVQFNTSFQIQPNHILNLKVVRSEPKPLDKCNVCFWGQDITTSVMAGLKEELDASKKELEDSFGKFNLRPYLQQAWNQISAIYSLPSLGYLSLQPKKLSMENISVKNDLLHIDLGITASPAVSFIKGSSHQTVVPNLSSNTNKNGFNISLDAALQYDSLSKVINGYMANKRFDISEGIIKKYVIIKDCKIYSGQNNNLVIGVQFSGSHNGTVYFTGKPVYNEAEKKIELQDFDYDLKTKDFLLKAAKWLFDKQIVNGIKKYTVIDMSGYYTKAAATIDTWLNKEWTKGITGAGKINDVRLTAVAVLQEHLLIRTNCAGSLQVTVNEVDLPF